MTTKELRAILQNKKIFQVVVKVDDVIVPVMSIKIIEDCFILLIDEKILRDKSDD